MAKVSVYNMEGKQIDTIELSDAVFGVREHRKQRPVPRFPAAEENPGDRREPVMQDRAPSALLSGQAAA